MYLIFKIMGFYTQVERPTSDGRIDAVIQTPDYIYIIECKLDRTADEALRQINDSDYAAPFSMDKRRNRCQLLKPDAWGRAVDY